MKKQFIQLLFAVGVVATLGSCKDFQEINKDPNVVDESSVPIDYLLNSSIYGAQMNPDIAERMFILYWDRVSGYERNGGISTFAINNDWINAYYSQVSGWLKDVTLAITIGEKRLADPATAAKPRLKNIVQMARIWRAYLYTEISDNFGPATISMYDGTTPTEMTNVEELYTLVLSELKDAVNTIDVEAELTTSEGKNDLFFGGDLAKWKRYANSLRMRFALRVANQVEFEDAATHTAGFIEANDQIASVLEKGGWDNTTAVMSRTWNTQQISLTFANLCVGLGGVEISGVQGIAHSGLKGISDADYAAYVKDPNQYLGLKMENYIAPSTNVSNAQFFMDYIPNKSDPRVYLLFTVPGINNADANYYPQDVKKGENITKILLANKDTTALPQAKTQDTVLFRSKCVFTVLPYGNSDRYGTNFSEFTGQARNWVTKSLKWRNLGNDNGNRRIFFGPWESYFLLAEAALKGWSVGTSDQAAYEKGIEKSFEWHGIAGLTTDYISSESYNRVGTSVKYAHQTEAVDKQMDYIDFQANLEDVTPSGRPNKSYQLKATPTISKFTYKYPKGRYATNNDKLTKIITQKYLANSPYLPNEAWHDYRRVNLPFMENPLVEVSFPNMTWYTKANSSQFIWKNIPQRLTFPVSLKESNPAAYASGVTELGGEDTPSTKLPWALAE